jgi:hypothetical protein
MEQGHEAWSMEQGAGSKKKKRDQRSEVRVQTKTGAWRVEQRAKII